MTEPLIGKNCSISNSAKIFSNVEIEDNVVIGDYCVLGSDEKNEKLKTIIKKNTKIFSHSIIHSDVFIGENSIIGHHTLIRKKTIIENDVQVGSYSDIEGSVKIEKFAKLHSNVHIGQHSLVMCFSYLFPYTILTNDPIPPSNLRMGVTVEPFAVICTRSTILPGKKIGFGSFVGANSLVNKDLNPETIGSGNPFKLRGSISLLKNPENNKNAYPWAGRFDKNYPENIKDIYQELRKKFIT